MIEAKATRLVFGKQIQDNVIIHKTFWWPRGGSAMRANWHAGDFETSINGNRDPDRVWLKYREATVHVIASGVTFSRSGIAELLPTVEPVDEPDTNPVSESELRRFYTAFVGANAVKGASEEKTLVAAKAYFIGRTVSRARIRELRGAQPMGRPAKVAENDTAT